MFIIELSEKWFFYIWIVSDNKASILKSQVPMKMEGKTLTLSNFLKNFLEYVDLFNVFSPTTKYLLKKLSEFDSVWHPS